MELLWAVKRKKSRESSRSRKGRSSGVLKRRHEAGESSRSSRSDKSSRRHSSRTRRNSRRSSRSRRRRSRQKSSRRSKSHRSHRCTINASRCPHRMSDVRLRQAAQRDRWRRLDASVAQMVQAFSLTEPKMLRAMERQKAYNGMRLLALYLEIVCIVITGVMGIFAQQMFNTRGGLDFYVFQMTAELILLTIVITNVTSPGTVSRFLNVIFFIIGVTCDFSHILLHIQRRGAYFKCTESDKLVQHCLWNIIPTHHHLLYTSGLLLLFHLAIVMVNVSAAVFYGGSLDHYQDKTPGKPEWVTNLPLHLHDKIDAARRLKPKARAFRLEDLPPGTTITREQEEQSVQYTTIGRDGSKKERPHDVTVTRRFTIKAPGIGSATGTRSWKAQKSSSLTDLTPGRQPKSNPRDNAIGVPNQWQPQHNQNGGAMFECPCGGPGEDLRASSGADQKGCPFEFPCGGTAEGPRTGAGKDPKTKTGRRSILSKVSSKVTQLPFLRGTNASKKK